jgi:hypothetical protein
MEHMRVKREPTGMAAAATTTISSTSLSYSKFPLSPTPPFHHHYRFLNNDNYPFE